MKLSKSVLAVLELLLISPAVLFMTALFVRNLQPPQYEPAHTAHKIVAWYAARPHLGLWVFLFALPFIALLTGGVTLLQRWRSEAAVRHAAHEILKSIQTQLATIVVAITTLAAGGVLAIVALHVLSD
jgi:hypothetical protein